MMLLVEEVVHGTGRGKCMVAITGSISMHG